MLHFFTWKVIQKRHVLIEILGCVGVCECVCVCVRLSLQVAVA